jgi:hypothetical protein
MIDSLVGLRETENIRQIVDIGIFKGGSVALYSKLFEPEKLVAIEVMPEPVGPLSEFIANENLGARVKPYYGIDQSDSKRIGAMLASESRIKT